MASLEVARNRVIDTGIHILVWRAEHIFNSAPIRFTEGAKESYLAARRKGYVAIKTSSHSVHLDGLGISIIGHRLRRLEHWHGGIEQPTQGDVLILAKSMKEGHQGMLLKKGLEAMEPILKRLSVEIAEYARPLDEDRYGSAPNGQEIQELLKRRAAEGFGIACFPEGVVEAGRTVQSADGKNGILGSLEDARDWMANHGWLEAQVNGMQRFDGRALYLMQRNLRNIGSGASFTPVAIDGSHRLLQPTHDHKTFVTPRGILAVTTAPLDLRSIRMTVGVTETIDEIKDVFAQNNSRLTPESLGDYLGRKVAALLPENKRGVYR